MKKNKDKKINLWYFLKSYKVLIAIYMVMLLCTAVADFFLVILTANAIDFFSNSNTSVALKLLFVVLGIKAVQFTLYFFINLIYHRVSTGSVYKLRLALTSKSFSYKSKTFADRDSGVFIQRILTEPDNIVDNLRCVFESFIELISQSAILIYITYLNFYIGIFIIVAFSITFILNVIKNSLYKRNSKITRKIDEKITSLTTEIIKSEKDIKSLALEEKLYQTSDKEFLNFQKNEFKRQGQNVACYSAKNIISALATTAMLILGIYLSEFSLLTFGSFMVIYGNQYMVWDLSFYFGEIYSRITEIQISSQRIFELFDDKVFECEKFGDVVLEKVKGDIEFRNVGFTFVEYEEDDEDKSQKKFFKKKSVNKKEKIISSKNTVFKDISFKVSANTTVAFVGKSGSGKSTIFNLMSKMLEVDKGEVLIDGVNINDLSKETLRSSISLVNQFPYIFDMTIKENLLLANKLATDVEIFKAIKDSALDEFVNSLKKGVDTKVGESGIKLSGGQKQRLAIARALLRKTPIILFDESTSSLDNFAQESVKKSIEKLKGNTTVAIVAHRLSTIKNVDKIFFLEEGQIVDEGTFEYLFETNDKFKNMFLAENI